MSTVGGEFAVMGSCAVRRRLRWRPAIILGGAFLSLALSLGVAAAETAPIATSAIKVEGNRRVEADTIRTYFQSRNSQDGKDRELKDHGFDAKAIDAGFKALYATGLFTDVQIKRSGDGLIVTVVEAPVIERIQFEGNKSVKDKQLTDELQSKVRGGLIPATVQADVTRLVDVYKHNGRFDVRIVPKTVAHGSDRVDLVFEITEGEKTTVKRIDFTGNHAFSARQLKDAIKTGQTNILSFLTSSDIYDADRIEADRDLLRRFYLKHGYVDARIVVARAELDAAAKGIVVAFTVEEGALYRFGVVDVQSRIPQIDGRSLAGDVKMRAGDLYNAELVDKTVDDLTIVLSKRGSPFAAVRARSDRNPDARTVDLVFAIEEGSRAYVERINIRGNLRTRDYVIRREFDIGEGDAYNRALIDRAERRLKSLDFFKTVKITTEPGSAPDRVVVDVDLEEKETGDFTFGGGYSTVDGVIGNISIGERNFLGLGQTVKLSLSYGQYSKAIDIGFVEPYFLGTRMALGVDVFGKQTSPNTYQSYGADNYGIGFKLSAPLTEETSAALRYSIYNQSVTLDPTLVTGTVSLPIQQAAAAGPAWVSSIGYTLAYDTRDNKKSPTNGIRAEFNQDIAGLGGDVNFIKTTEDVRAYHEIAGDIVGMARLQSGYLTSWGGQDVPLLNRFFGGPQLVRGFAPNGIGPRDLTPGSTMDNIGGTAYWATTAEAQAPIPYLPSDFGLKIAVFADAGSVWVPGGQANIPALAQSFTVGNSSVIRSSFGAGLVWSSPFGPIRVDYAYPVTKAGYDVTQRLNFSAGGF
jgi:outer membrane protein insertion porin family